MRQPLSVGLLCVCVSTAVLLWAPRHRCSPEQATQHFLEKVRTAVRAQLGGGALLALTRSCFQVVSPCSFTLCCFLCSLVAAGRATAGCHLVRFHKRFLGLFVAAGVDRWLAGMIGGRFGCWCCERRGFCLLFHLQPGSMATWWSTLTFKCLCDLQA